MDELINQVRALHIELGDTVVVTVPSFTTRTQANAMQQTLRNTLSNYDGPILFLQGGMDITSLSEENLRTVGLVKASIRDNLAEVVAAYDHLAYMLATKPLVPEFGKTDDALDKASLRMIEAVKAAKEALNNA